MDDERMLFDLLQQIQEGSQEAARQFLDRYGRYILRVIRRQLHDKLRGEFDSQDFLQDVCLSFFRRPPSPEKFPDQEALRRFLCNLARNKVVDRVRHRRAQRFAPERIHSLDGSARYEARHLVGREPAPSESLRAADAINPCVFEGYPDPEQIVRMVRDGCSREEMARVLRVSVRQVTRLLAQLRQRLGQ
jgi:RNA polymerase sigma factor (sigma-70 family)